VAYSRHDITPHLANTAGTVGTSYTYDPYGAESSTGTASSNTFQYTRRQNDGATGLDYYRARYYSPTQQRFISQDPIGFASGQTDLYGFVRDDPIDHRDPRGLFGTPIECVAGAVVGGIGGAWGAGAENGSRKAVIGNFLLGAGTGCIAGLLDLPLLNSFLGRFTLASVTDILGQTQECSGYCSNYNVLSIVGAGLGAGLGGALGSGVIDGLGTGAVEGTTAGVEGTALTGAARIIVGDGLIGVPWGLPIQLTGYYAGKRFGY
jgi:RHS repeat-associated protein